MSTPTRNTPATVRGLRAALASGALDVPDLADGRPVGGTLSGPAVAEDRLITAAHELAGREAA